MRTFDLLHGSHNIIAAFMFVDMTLRLSILIDKVTPSTIASFPKKKL